MSKTIRNPTLAALRALMIAPPPSPPRPVLSPSACRPLPPFPKTAKTSRKVSREIEIKARRDPFNRAEHVRVPYLGPAPKTPASAAKLRREATLMCPCRLCALALYPPTTFAEYQQLGLREPSLERVADELALFLAPRPHTWAVAACFEEMTGGAT